MVGKGFFSLHQELWNIYSDVLKTPDPDGLSERLSAMHKAVLDEKCCSSLEAYERYLKLIALHTQALNVESYSLLKPDIFHAEMAREPSLPFSIFGMALTELRCGNRVRARHLLRRLSATRYHERHRGRALLAELVNKEAAPA